MSSVMLTLEYEVEVFYDAPYQSDELIPTSAFVHTKVPHPMEAFLKNDALDEFYRKQARGLIEP